MVELIRSSGAQARFRIPHLASSAPLRQHVTTALEALSGVQRVQRSARGDIVSLVFDAPLNALTLAQQLETIVADYTPDPLPREPRSRTTLNRQIDTHAAQVRDVREQAVAQWHRLSVAQTLAHFDTDPDTGLGDLEARELLRRYGPNALSEAESRSDWSIFVEQFQSPPVAMLGVAAVVSVATGGVPDALVILAVVGINAGIGYATKSQSERTIHALQRMVKPTAEVLRDGTVRQMDAAGVVPGDVIILRPGSFIPADARLIDTHHLNVDESALTGESLPVSKRDAPLDHDPPLAERLNMLYMGTTVTGGEAGGVVTATGRDTEIGKIQSLVGTAQALRTPLQTQLEQIGGQLAWLSTAVCAAVFGIGLLRGYGLLEMLKNAISLAVAAAPEGLPTVATTILALGIREMKRHRVLILHLDAIETLARPK